METKRRVAVIKSENGMTANVGEMKRKGVACVIYREDGVTSSGFFIHETLDEVVSMVTKALDSRNARYHVSYYPPISPAAQTEKYY